MLSITAPVDGDETDPAWAEEVTDAVNGGIDGVSGNFTVAGNLSVTGIGQKIFVRKTANETVNNTSVLQNDDVLLASLTANAVYYMKTGLAFTSNATADFKYGFTYPTSTTIRNVTQGFNVGGAFVSPFLPETLAPGFGGGALSGTAEDFILLTGLVIVEQYCWYTATTVGTEYCEPIEYGARGRIVPTPGEGGMTQPDVDRLADLIGARTRVRVGEIEGRLDGFTSKSYRIIQDGERPHTIQVDRPALLPPLAELEPMNEVTLAAFRVAQARLEQESMARKRASQMRQSVLAMTPAQLATVFRDDPEVAARVEEARVTPPGTREGDAR